MMKKNLVCGPFFTVAIKDNMNEKLIKFFTKYKKLFEDGMSTGDADDVLMDLMGIVDDNDAEVIIEKLKKDNL